MIPTVEDILLMLARKECTHEQAMAWMAQHFVMAEEEARRPEARANEWVPVSERLPEVPLGGEEEFWVCAHRKHNGKRYVFALSYVNKPQLDPRTKEPADWALESEDDSFDAIGWHQVGPSESYDEYYKGVDESEIIAWMPIRKPEAPVSPLVMPTEKK